MISYSLRMTLIFWFSFDKLVQTFLEITPIQKLTWSQEMTENSDPHDKDF